MHTRARGNPGAVVPAGDARPPVTGSVGCAGTTTIIVNRLIIQTPESGGDPQQEGGGDREAETQKTQTFFLFFLF